MWVMHLLQGQGHVEMLRVAGVGQILQRWLVIYTLHMGHADTRAARDQPMSQGPQRPGSCSVDC